MGRTRKFTKEIYNALSEGVEDKEEVWDKVVDFFSDIWTSACNAFTGVSLEEDFSNFSTYLRDVADLNNYTAEEITNIFRNVEDVDVHYENVNRNANQQIRDYATIVKKLKEAISDVNFTNTYSTDTFLAAIPQEAQRLMGAQWENILSKDIEDITEEELNMIAIYLVQSGDEELLEDMIIQCYEIVQPDTGIKNPTVYQDATGHVVEKYRYTASAKLDMLAAAVKRVATTWVAVDCEMGDTELSWIHTAIQYDSLLSAMQKCDDLVMVTETSNYGDGTRRYLNEELIDITYNFDGSISVAMYPYMSPAISLEGEAQGKETLTISRVDEDAAGQDRLINHAFTYVNAYVGTEGGVMGALGTESVNQIASGVVGTVPGFSEVMGVISVVEAGMNAAEAEALMEYATETASWGRVVDEFSMACVQTTSDRFPTSPQIL